MIIAPMPRQRLFTMDKKRALLAAFLIFCVLLSATGCSAGSAKEFAASASGMWLRDGDSRGVSLEIWEDGTWLQHSLKGAQWTRIGLGTIAYNRAEKKHEFVNEMTENSQLVDLFEDSVLILSGEKYYRADVSIDQMDGKWYLSNDLFNDYFHIEGDTYIYYEWQGMGHFPLYSGDLTWEDSTREWVAYSEEIGGTLKALTLLSANDMQAGQEWYARMEDVPVDSHAHAFDDNSLLLTPEDAYDYEDPIVLDGGVFGEWPCEDRPAAYWGVIIPEAGSYKVSVEYSREEPESVPGDVQFEIWVAERGEWVSSSSQWFGDRCQNTNFFFEPTGGLSDYQTVDGMFYDLPEGELRLVVSPGYYASEVSPFFINMRSVYVQKVSEEEVGEGAPLADAPSDSAGPSQDAYFLEGGSEWLEFYDDNTGVWFDGKLYPITYEIDGDWMAVFLESGSCFEFAVLDENTLFHEAFDYTYTKKP